MEIEKQIEAILFFKGESMPLNYFEDLFKISKEEVKQSVNNLKNNLINRGITLIEKENEILLSTAGEYSSLIENIQKEELNKDLSKASLEILSVILYKNGATKNEIDYIRGVNSSFSLRILLMRGLIERIIDEKDNRRYIYKPTFELFSFMGINKIEDLPDYELTLENIKNAENDLNLLNKEITDE